MSRKFSIMTTVDFDKLDKEIEECVINGELDPYIFMNEDTANAIERGVGADIVVDINSVVRARDNTKATYCGYKVFINNELRFGVVEIR